MKNICIIPARSGSKRIKNKNTIKFFGKPLIYRAISAAKKSKLFSNIYISTDSKKIIKISNNSGVKFLKRSKKFSSDNATIHNVVQESIFMLKNNGEKFNNVCCILPTAALINYKNLVKCYRLLVSKKVNFVIPVSRFSYPPQRGLKLKNKKIYMIKKNNYNINSQKFEKIYHDAGQFYWGTAKGFINNKSTFNGDALGFILKPSEVQDIDDSDDLKIAKMKFKHLYK